MHPNTVSNQSTSRSKNVVATLSALVLTVLAAIGLSACATGTPADTWEQPNQNAQNTRYSGGRINTGTIENMGVAWTADIKTKAGFGTDAPSPYITEDNVFVQNVAGRYIALDLKTGQRSPAASIRANAAAKPSWLAKIESNPMEKLAPEVSPISTTGEDDARIVVGAGEQNVVAFNVDSDVTTAWTSEIESPSGTTPRIMSNMAAADGQVFAPVVNVPVNAKTTAPTELFNRLLKASKSTGQLVSLNSSNGKVNWTKDLSSAPLGGATVVNDIVLTTTIDGNIYAFDRDGGDELWSSELPAGSVAPVAVYDDTIVVPASLALKKGQKPQVVAFRIGGLGKVGGAAAPKLEKAVEAERAKATEQKPAAESEGAAAVDGKAIFVATCAGCHTFTAAGTSGQVGPNLDQTSFTVAQIITQVTNGKGAMPAFKGTISDEEIKALAEYIEANKK